MSFEATSVSPLSRREDGQVSASSDEIAIRVTNLSKTYQIYERPEDRLKQALYPRLERMVGRESRNYFREFWALKDISFEVKVGETVGVIGRNGAGKSTLLQIICGTLHPSAGTVETIGRVAALLELGSGFNPEFTGRENVYLNAAILGLTPEEINAKFDDIAAFADIGDFVEQPVKSYSSGMIVRLAFAVIAHVDADILIIDEALAVGDSFFTQKCMRFLRDFMKTGTVLFVSHDTGAVLNLCNRAIWLHEGAIVANGNPKRVTESYLEKQYEAEQGESNVVEESDMRSVELPRARRDMRLDFINETTLRNDIEVFSFSPDSPSFGKNGAKILEVELQDDAGNTLSWVVGGERVKLVILCEAKERLLSPIIGFQVRDRLGQVIFADNTYITYRDQRVVIQPGEHFFGEFEFHMPVMPLGDYSVSAAVAEGTQNRHVQHHWVHDALMFKVHSTSVCFGLIGIAMESIRIAVQP